MNHSGPESILIIKLSAIGDVVHTLPALEVLKKNYPQSRIDWLVEEESFPIIEGHSYLDRIIVSKRKRWVRALTRGEARRVPGEVKIFLSRLRSRRYDLVIDFQGLLKSGLLVWLSKGAQKVGMTGSREASRVFLSHRPIPVNYRQHAIERYLQVCSFLGCEMVNWEGRVYYGKEHVEGIRRLLYESGWNGEPIVTVSPMARWDTKLWRKEAFAELADKIQTLFGHKVVFTGSNSDKTYIDEIAGLMRSQAITTAGHINLKELAYLFELSAAAVTTDTGPMHIAAAMGCPVVALFGPTDPRRTGPYGPGHRIVRIGLDCSPCFKKHCDNPKCMEQITVEEVLEAVKAMLR